MAKTKKPKYYDKMLKSIKDSFDSDFKVIKTDYLGKFENTDEEYDMNYDSHVFITLAILDNEVALYQDCYDLQGDLIDKDCTIIYYDTLKYITGLKLDAIEVLYGRKDV